MMKFALRAAVAALVLTPPVAPALAQPAAAPAVPPIVYQTRTLPNVAGAGPGGRLTGHYRAAVASGVELTVDASVRYIGPSLLGVDAPLDVRQGDFADGQIGARLDFGRFGISLDVDNVADARGSRFSFGNPFGVGDRDQVTPIRPRTVRIGFDANF
jgi:hypothetical protein